MKHIIPLFIVVALCSAYGHNEPDVCDLIYREPSTQRLGIVSPPIPTFNANTSTSESLRQLARFLTEQRNRHAKAVNDFKYLCQSYPDISFVWRDSIVSRINDVAKSYQWKKLSRANRDILSRFERTECCKYVQTKVTEIVGIISEKDYELSQKTKSTGNNNNTNQKHGKFRVFSVGGGEMVLVNWDTGVFITNKLPKLTHRQRRNNIRAHNLSSRFDEEQYRRNHPEDPNLINYHPNVIDYQTGNIIVTQPIGEIGELEEIGSWD